MHIMQVIIIYLLDLASILQINTWLKNLITIYMSILISQIQKLHLFEYVFHLFINIRFDVIDM
jgi:hypothetical protein